MRIGVVGVGVIASAVVRGLERKYGDKADFFLSPRNAEKSMALQGAYGNVRVMETNQAVVDASDIVIVSVLPKVAKEVVSSLRFSSRHHIVSFVSEPRLASLAEWVGECATISRVIPLEFIEHHAGPVLLYPDTPVVHDLLVGLGEVVVPESEDDFLAMQALSSVMGGFFYLADSIVAWTGTKGIKEDVAAPYLFAMFKALAGQGLETSPEDVASLWKAMTPGGLNEDVIRSIKNAGGFALWTSALDKVLERLR
jgi:Pyrroline-5-carboxylate reductase